MAPTIEIVENVKCVLGEGPYWDDQTQLLYFVDIPESTVYKYDVRTKTVTSVVVDKSKEKSVSLIIPLAGKKDKFIIGYGKELAILTWDGISDHPNGLEILLAVEHGLNTRFNDGKADPVGMYHSDDILIKAALSMINSNWDTDHQLLGISIGRLWAGTMAPVPSKPGDIEMREGSLYSLNENGTSVTRHASAIGVSNGLAWSSDKKVLYYIDSFNRAIDAFDYDIQSGTIKNRRVVFDLKKHNLKGDPDGMTIDKDDKLWVANFGGSAVRQIDPLTGDLLQSIELPANQITSVVWAGPQLDELYVTSANILNDNSPQGGRLFRITGLGTSGYPSVPVKL